MNDILERHISDRLNRLQSRSIPTADMQYELTEAVYQLVRQVARIADVLEEVHK